MVEISIQEKNPTMVQPDQGAGAFVHVLESLRIVDVFSEEAFNKISWPVFSLFKTPNALTSFVEAGHDRQYIKSGFELNGIWKKKLITPPLQYFCQIVKRENP